MSYKYSPWLQSIRPMTEMYSYATHGKRKNEIEVNTAYSERPDKKNMATDMRKWEHDKKTDPPTHPTPKKTTRHTLYILNIFNVF